ncbi:MAG TPA: C4-dicarboxylate transporter DcuC [Gemmataceae bacterium]|nr:C4-dicarboxylate transporter DcuC [Gemmataceae bacterium]
MILFAGLIVIAVAVWAILRQIDVRLALLLAALGLGCLAGHVEVIVQKFLMGLTNGQFVIPIGCSLGFVYVLRQTGCDQHLVHLLVRPIRRVRFLLIPGTVVVGALVNIPVVSQMSTAVLVGAVLVPLLRAARISPVTTGAALLLGSSLGGDLLNPGAPEVRTVSEASKIPITEGRWMAHALPLFLIELTVTVVVFWLLSVRAEAKASHDREGAEKSLPHGRGSDSATFRINPLKALVPFVPVALLFLTALPEPFRLLRVPTSWLVNVEHFHGPAAERQAVFDSRLIGAAMLIGVVAAALTDRSRVRHTAETFFEGVGYAFTRIISLIICAGCFGEGVKQIGLAKLLGVLLESYPGLLVPAAMVLPLAFAMLCGSGMASTQSLFGFFVEPAHYVGYDPLRLGAMVSLAAAAGRTVSPVAAVTLTCAALAEVNPLQLVRRLVIPLLAGMLAMLLASMLLGMPM